MSRNTDLNARILAANDIETMQAWAKRYIWWKTPEAAVAWPARLARQIMNIGTFEDMMQFAENCGDDLLRDILQSAEAGELNARSWSCWHIRLGMSDVHTVPLLPQRKFG